jgi:hypothetical protein
MEYIFFYFEREREHQMSLESNEYNAVVFALPGQHVKGRI